MNGKASGGENPAWFRKVQMRLFRSELQLIKTGSLEDFQARLADAVRDQVDVVIAIGGDGTVNTLIQKLGGTGVAMLVIPAGTANDLARELGILGHIDDVVQQIRSGEPEPIDLIRINGRLMATNGGLGLAAHVARHVNLIRDRVPAFKKVMQLMHHRVYTMVLGTDLLMPKLARMQVRIESDEFVGDAETPLVMVNNQPSLAGKFRVAPRTNNHDGTFNVTVFRHKRRRDFLECLLNIRRGIDVTSDPELVQFETKATQLKILASEKDEPFFGDGELFTSGREFNIDILPSALKVYSAREALNLLEGLS